MAAPSSRSRAAAASPAARQEDDRELRNYRLEERSGQEELATIYRARHLTLDRPVELHILRRSDWISVSRFQQAARLAARLNSYPTILPVIDAGHDDHYGYYLVTPPVNGRPLQTLLDQGPLPAAETVQILSQVARALDTIHGFGIIHRDIQPATIIIADGPAPEGIQPDEAADGRARRAYLTNFSLAYSPDGPDLSQLDEADYLTPYAAPEQNFRDQAPSTALDIYALGAVLYHMLSGELPPAPGQEIPSLGRKEPALSPADRVVRRMLSPQPNLRYPTAGQAVAALRQALREVVGAEVRPPAPLVATSYAADSAEVEWLENPAETLLGDLIDAGFLQQSRELSKELRKVTPLRQRLNDWSGKSPIHRRQLGSTIQIEHVVSYTFYIYELRAYYETRTQPQVRERPHQGSRISDREPPSELWKIPLPEMPPFTDSKPQELVIPHSARVQPCPRCEASGEVVCERCHGRGTTEVSRVVQNPDGSRGRRVFAEDCTACSGEGGVACPRCQRAGQLLQEEVFEWSRWGKLWENTDDETGLPLPDIRARAQEVYSGVINVKDQRWHAIAPLHELIESAIKVDAQEQSQLLHAELCIKGAVVTEVDYREHGEVRTLYLIGFDPPTVRGDFSIYDKERLIYAAAALVVLIVIALLILRPF